jgi:hypothetical protein
MNEISIPEKTTLTGFAAIFGMARSTLSGWRATDTRFPVADTAGKFSTIDLGAYLELRELESMTADEHRQQLRAGADALDRHIESGLFRGMETRVKRIVHEMRTGDPEEARLERIKEIEEQLSTGGTVAVEINNAGSSGKTTPRTGEKEKEKCRN